MKWVRQAESVHQAAEKGERGREQSTGRQNQSNEKQLPVHRTSVARSSRWRPDSNSNSQLVKLIGSRHGMRKAFLKRAKPAGRGTGRSRGKRRSDPAVRGWFVRPKKSGA